MMRKFIDQEKSVNTGITALGLDAIKKLLDNTYGERIHIDIKHMSRKSRRDYYETLQQPEFNDVPVIVDPIDGFWTSGEFKSLRKYFEIHATDFLTQNGSKIKQSQNIISPQQLMDKFFPENFLNFIKKHY